MGMLLNRHRGRHGDDVNAEGDTPDAPSKSWKRDELDAYAAAANGIDVFAASNKGEVLDLIEAHTPNAEGDTPDADGGTPTE